MNKVIIGIAVLVILGAGVYFMSNGGTNDSDMTTEGQDGSATDNRSGDMESFSGSFRELAMRGGSYSCTFTHSTEGSVSSGTVFVDGERLRGDFRSETETMDVESHMITKDGYVYTWSPLSSQGFKMAVNEEGADAMDEELTSSGNYADLDQEYEYDCTTWSVDESKFALPNMSFIEFDAMMQLQAI